MEASLDDVVLVLRDDRDLGLADDTPFYARLRRVRELSLVAPLHAFEHQLHALDRVLVELLFGAPRLLPAIGGGHTTSYRCLSAAVRCPSAAVTGKRHLVLVLVQILVLVLAPVPGLVRVLILVVTSTGSSVAALAAASKATWVAMLLNKSDI